MNIMYLGPYRTNLIHYLEDFGDNVVNTEQPLHISDIDSQTDYLISFGYRYILKPDVLELFPDKAINLHISFLPWNRGADPNLWSFLEDTPKGVTIHYIDKGLDTGDIIAQRQIAPNINDTLRSSYERLILSVTELFQEYWPVIRKGGVLRIPQSGEGSYHNSADKNKYIYLLNQGWETPVKNLIGKAKGYTWEHNMYG